MRDYGSRKPMTKWFDRVWYPFGTCDKPCCMLFQARIKIDRLQRWRPCRILVGGIVDLFASRIPDEVIRDLFFVMAKNPRHRFRIVTRDAFRMEQWFGSHASTELQKSLIEADVQYPCENIDLGIIARTQVELHDQLGALVSSPAARRFIVFDRIHGPIDLTDIDCPGMVYEKSQVTSCRVCFGKEYICDRGRYNALVEDIHEVIVGPVTLGDGEIWRQEIMDQCEDHHVNVIHFEVSPPPEPVILHV